MDCSFFFFFFLHVLLIGAGSFHEVWDRCFDVVLIKIEATFASSFIFTFELIPSLCKPIDQPHCPSIFGFSPSSPRRLNSVVSGRSVTCIKLRLFTTDWTWTYMTVPLSYDIIPQVCLWIYFGIVTVKNLVKVLMFLKRNIDVFSV